MNFTESSRKACWLGLLLTTLVVSSAARAASWKEKVLYSFQGGSDAATPAGGVVLDQQGNLYGAALGGPQGEGTVFQLVRPKQKGGAWTESVLYAFQGKATNDGALPEGGLIIDRAGNVYGVTAYGGSGGCILLGTVVGCGAVYEVSPPKAKGGAWTETILYSFQGGKDGYLPFGDLTFDAAGNLYGATYYGGGYGSCNYPFYQYCGTVFELSPPKTKGGKWTEKVLYSFKSGTDGANPNGGLVLDKNGAIYGTTYFGGDESGQCGARGCGTAFKLDPPTKKGNAWMETILHRFEFSAGEANPAAGMTFDGKGYLYGTTVGTIFRLAPPSTKPGRWTETILYTFTQDAYGPQDTLIFDKNGNLYGTTNVGSGQSLYGSVFRLKPPYKKTGRWTFSVVHGFLGPPDGDFPAASLVFDVNGDLYSTTRAGGTGTTCSGYCGTVFEVSP